MVAASTALQDEKPNPDPEVRDNQEHPNNPMDPDSIFNALGFGWFQAKFIIFTTYGMLFPQAAVLIFNFIGADLPHRCFIEGCDDPVNPKWFDPVVNHTLENGTFHVTGWMNNYTSMSLIGDFKLNAPANRHWYCTYQDVVATTQRCAVNYTAGDTCTNGWIYNQDVIKSSLVTQFDLVCTDAWKSTLLNTLTALGLLVGTIFLGPLPDIIGRKKAMAFFTLWMAAFGIGSVFSPSYEAFAAMRFFTGMAGQAAAVAFAIWGIEAMAPNLRLGFYCTLGLGVTFGNLLSGLAAYYLREWWQLQLAIFIPFSFTLISLFFLPESVRWLVSKKRYEEAQKIFLEASRNNGRTIPDHLLAIPPADEVTSSEENSLNENRRPFRMFWEILKTPCLIKRIFILFFAWFAQMLLSFGLNFASANISSDIYLNYTLIMLVDLPAIVTVYFTAERFGRRLVINIGLILGGICCLIAGLVQSDTTITLVFSLLGKFFAVSFATSNYIITLELFPTPVRSMTLALITTAGKIGTVVSPSIAALGKSNPNTPYVIFGAVSLFAGLLTLLLPETKGLPLPITVQDAINMKMTSINFCCRKNNKKNSTLDKNSND